MPSKAHTPSLHQLQAIEKEHADFRAQVNQLASILWLEDGRILGIRGNGAEDDSGSGRLDWGLRWLLSKLQAPGAQGLA